MLEYDRWVRRLLAPAIGACLGTFTSPALATFSLVAVNAGTGESGVAIASCVGSDFDLAEAVRLDAEWGALVAQGGFSADDRDALVAELEAGASPEAALGVVTDPDRESSGGLGASHRQFAIVGGDGSSAAWSGSDLGEVALDRHGRLGDWSWSVQGNLLEDALVLQEFLDGFSAEEAPVERRLSLALLGVVRSGRGDARCAPEVADAYFVATLSATGVRWERSAVHDRATDASAWLAGLTEQPLAEEPSEAGAGKGGCVFASGTADPCASGLAAAVAIALVTLRRRRRTFTAS